MSKFASQVASCLETVSTTRGSGWVYIQRATVCYAGVTHPLPRVVLTFCHGDM
jgi:hypothetical protein